MLSLVKLQQVRTFNLWSLWDWGLVLFKPPNWEVHDANSELQLANFMEAMFGPLTILKDEDHEHGTWAGAFLVGEKQRSGKGRKRFRDVWNLWCPMIGTFNVSSCSEKFVFILRFPSAKYCEGRKKSSSERYGGASNLRKWVSPKDSKTMNMMYIIFCTSQIGSQVVKSQFFGSYPPPWLKSFNVQLRFLASLGCPKFGIDFSCEVIWKLLWLAGAMVNWEMRTLFTLFIIPMTWPTIPHQKTKDKTTELQKDLNTCFNINVSMDMLQLRFLVNSLSSLKWLPVLGKGNTNKVQLVTREVPRETCAESDAFFLKLTAVVMRAYKHTHTHIYIYIIYL